MTRVSPTLQALNRGAIKAPLDVSSTDYGIPDAVPVLPHDDVVDFFGGGMIHKVDESQFDVAVCPLIERNVEKINLGELEPVLP